MVDVVAVGDVNLDIIARFGQYPLRGQDALADAIEFHCGGSAANVAVAMARLGLVVRLISRLGTDPWAAVVLHCLERAGLILDSLQRDQDVMTGLMYIVVVPDGERTMLCHRGANAMTDPGEIHDGQIRGAQHLHLSGYALLAEPQRSAARRAFEAARRHGLTVSLDPGQAICQTAPNDIRALLPEVDILVPSLPEAQYLTGLSSPKECAVAALALGAKVVALKLGRQGCLIGTAEESFHLPAFVVKAQDSTGAGDSFAAGLIAGFLGGLDWQGAGTLANAMGALSAARVGAGTPAEISGEIRALLQDRRQSHFAEACPNGLAQARGFAETLVKR